MKTIFLVDDSATILLSISGILGKAGYAVEKAPSALDALKKFQAGVKVVVMVDDTPGQLGRLFGELGVLDVNVEDFRLEHSPGAQFGLAEISVVPDAVHRTVTGLEARGWKIASIPDD